MTGGVRSTPNEKQNGRERALAAGKIQSEENLSDLTNPQRGALLHLGNFNIHLGHKTMRLLSSSIVIL